jgi:hypothetical protein
MPGSPVVDWDHTQGVSSVALEHVSDTKALRRFAVEGTQPAAKRAVGNVATEVRDAAAAKMGGKTAPAPAESIDDAAQSVKAQSKPVFEKLDRLTKGDDMTFSDWQARTWRANYSSCD